MINRKSLNLTIGAALLAGMVALSGCGPAPYSRSTTTTEQVTTTPAVVTPMTTTTTTETHQQP